MIRTRFILAVGVSLGLCLSAVASFAHAQNSEDERADAEGTRYRYSDCHLHLLNFLQMGEFLNDDKAFPASRWGEVDHQRFLTLPAGERWRRVAGVLEAMDQGRIENALVFGMPIIKKWSANETYERPDGYLDSESHVLLARDTDLILASAVVDYQQKFSDEPQQLAELRRLAPFLCGFDTTDLGAVDLLVERIREFPGVWQGIGEVFTRHDDVTHLSLGERPRSNHPAMLRVCRFAGQNFLPVSIHHNISPVSRPGVTRPPLYLDELVELFRYCHEEPGSGRESTVFIWCHAGVSRRIHAENLHYWVDEVLALYEDHVYVDLSWIVFENYIDQDPEVWAKLVEKYPNRFMLGSDVVGGASDAGESLSRYEPWLKLLKPKTRRLVARENFVNLMDRMAQRRRLAGLSLDESGKKEATHLQGIVLPVDYKYPEYADMPRLTDEESFVRSRLEREPGAKKEDPDAGGSG